MTKDKIALTHEILRGLVGSTAHGTGLDGQEDRDEMGVFIEPPEYMLGLERVEHYLERTAAEGVRSGPDDVDLMLYSLRKFVTLCAKGNPSVLLLLWLPDYLRITPWGSDLVRLRDAFVSQEAGWRFLCYLVGQRQALTGERNKKVIRPDIVEKFGYDTKFAMHALRLGYQGIQFVEHGTITMPVPEPTRTFLRQVRAGEVKYQDALDMLHELEARLRTVTEHCQKHADLKRINRFLVDTYQSYWED